MEKKKDSGQRRRNIRFRPQPELLGLIDYRTDMKDPFEPQVYALVDNESATGCGVVVLSNERLMTGQMCRIQIGNHLPMVAEIRWRRDPDEDVMRLGLMYLE